MVGHSLAWKGNKDPSDVLWFFFTRMLPLRYTEMYFMQESCILRCLLSSWQYLISWVSAK